jgi:hypothetical protein
MIKIFFSKNKITIPKIQFFEEYNKKNVKSVRKYLVGSLTL